MRSPDSPGSSQNKHERSFLKPARWRGSGAVGGRDRAPGGTPGPILAGSTGTADPAADGRTPVAPLTPSAPARRSAPAPRRLAPVAGAAAPGGYRVLTPGEATFYGDHLLRLDKDDRRLRFAHETADRFIERYVRGIDWSCAFVVVWVQDGVPRGAAHVAWPPTAWLDGAEVAVSVEGPWQRRGIGTGLVTAAVAEARRRNLAAFSFYGLVENEGIRRLLRRFGVITRRSGGEIEGRLDLPADPANDRRGLSARGRRRREVSRAASRPDGLRAAADRLDLTPKI